MNKSGITMVSIVIYVVIFFIFTVFAVAMSTNMNYKTLSDKGEIFINEQFEKLQYNLVKSSKSSDSVDNILGKITFSNNDEYKYDIDKKQILKNEGVLVSNVESFNILDTTNLKNKPQDFDYNIDNAKQSILVEVKFKKYGVEKTSQIFIVAGDENNVQN
jgi:hypothetical protein